MKIKLSTDTMNKPIHPLSYLMSEFIKTYDNDPYTYPFWEIKKRQVEFKHWYFMVAREKWKNQDYKHTSLNFRAGDSNRYPPEIKRLIKAGLF